MVRITKVYTKKGDTGKTGAQKSKALSKSSLKIEVLGLMDELNSFLGWVVILCNDKKFSHLKKRLLIIQNNLFNIGAYICGTDKLEQAEIFFSKLVTELENDIDLMNAKLPSLDSFVLPGGNEISARLHIARTTCRRVERSVTAYAEEQNDTIVIPYLNRLSDWLFVAARFVLLDENIQERLWVPIWKK